MRAWGHLKGVAGVAAGLLLCAALALWIVSALGSHEKAARPHLALIRTAPASPASKKPTTKELLLRAELLLQEQRAVQRSKVALKQARHEIARLKGSRQRLRTTVRRVRRAPHGRGSTARTQQRRRAKQRQRTRELRKRATREARRSQQQQRIQEQRAQRRRIRQQRAERRKRRTAERNERL